MRVTLPAFDCQEQLVSDGRCYREMKAVTVVTVQYAQTLDNRCMKSNWLRAAFRLAVLITAAAACALASSKTEQISSLNGSGISDGLRQAVADKGYRITLDDGWTAEFWFAKALKLEARDVAGALYPELSDGEFVGVVHFAKGMSDYRGQSIPAGFYTLRYQLLPQDGNHMGVAPNPDFLLAIPAADDTNPDQTYPYRKLIGLSAKSTSTGHPAVISLEGAGEPGTVSKQDSGDIVFNVELTSSGGSKEKLGIVVKGAAAQ